VSEPLYRSVYQGTWLLVGALAVGPPAELRGRAQSALTWVLWAGWATALTIAYSSANGFVNFGVGALAVSATALAVLATGVEEGAGVKERGTAAVRSRVSLAAVIAVAVFAVVAGLQAAYRDGPPLTLTARVQAGPYAGLLTTHERSAYLTGVSDLIAPRTPAGSRLTVLGSAPYAYLVGDALPVMPHPWLEPTALASSTVTSQLKRYFSAPDRAPDVIVVERSGLPTDIGATELGLLCGGSFVRASSFGRLDLWVRE
jgi:hypothetical protein